MSFLGGLKKFNSTISHIDNSKKEIKRLTDKSQWTDDDRHCIKVSKIWSLINIVLLAPVGVAFYFLTSLLFSFSELFLLGLFGMLILGWAYGTSITKARSYTADNAPSLGAIILSWLAIGGLFVTIIIVVLVKLISLGAWEPFN